MIRAALRLLLLGCAVLLFAGSIWWDNAANRGIMPPPATPIPFTDVPRGGVNAYLLHAEVIFNPDGSINPDNKVKRTFEMIAAAGMHWVRVQFPWEDIEICGKGNFRDTCRGYEADAWAKYDYIVREAERNGLELIVRLDSPPNWARQRFRATEEVKIQEAAGKRVTGPPDNLADFGDFAAAVAQRYRQELRFFQIWNEPNLPGEWNYHRQDPAELVALLRLARERIKAVNPNAVILFPALSPTDGRGEGMNDLDYLQGMYNAGGRDHFDIMSAQLYGLGQPPTEHRYIKPGNSPLHPIDTKTDVGRVVLLREIMVRNGDERKAIWVSELGWNSAPKTLGAAALTWGEPVSEQLKGEYLVQAMQRAQREWPWMGPMCIWMFRWGGEPPNPNDPTPFFQLVDFDFNPLPAYSAIQTYLTTAQTSPAPAERNPLATAATIVSGGLLLATSAWLFPVLTALLATVERGSRSRRRMIYTRFTGALAHLPRPSDRTTLTLQGLALLLFYFGSPQLPITALGGLIFLALALLRPRLALLFVPATVPLYLAPKGVWDARFGLSRPAGYFIPAHEFVLLCVLAGAALVLMRERPWRQINLRAMLKAGSPLWPILLFVVAGTLGVVVAAARGAALREWRWLIVEPLLFYGLVRLWARDTQFRWQLIWAWLITGAVVAAIGLLQLGGIDLAALLPQGQCFSQRVVLAEGGLRRISSVYCHPNNLALALDRVWPLWAALALPSLVVQGRLARLDRQGWLPIGGALLCLAALGATFSKGAFLGVFMALVVLGLMLRQRRHALGTPLLALAALGAIGGLLLGGTLGIERLNPLGGSSGARVELWDAALRMWRDHPLTGVGLDQFYHYRTAPEFGDRYIDPAARATNEQYASHPHNLVLDLLVRLGPLGLLTIGWLVIHFFRRAYRLAALPGRDGLLALGLLAGMVAALTHGLVDNFYFVPDLAFSFWLMVGLADTLHRSARPQTESKHQDRHGAIRRKRQHVSADRA